ncbi:MAG: phosphate ABC transporter permease PstA [Anaerolineales bacterium]
MSLASNNNLRRHLVGGIWKRMFVFSTVITLFALLTLLYKVTSESFGLVAVELTVNPESLAQDGVKINQMSKSQMISVINDQISKGRYRKLDYDKPFDQRTRSEIFQVLVDEVVQPSIVRTWPLLQSLLNRDEIYSEYMDLNPNTKLVMRSWLNSNFIVSPQSSDPEKAGVRTAILGSLWVVLIAIIFAFPIGVGAAINLEEYSTDSVINRFISTNIYNLAGVPSIIYGMLGLAIFVRALEPLTSGSLFGVVDPTTANGRTILSGGLTLGLLILPLIIVNSQESIKAVSNSLREASYGLGATKWQTIWHHVLPNALPGILTGNILAVSRAIGETAPLIVVGASTFITFDPDGPFSKFTTLPVQIYQWTSRPQSEFQNIAAAGILVLILMLVLLNGLAISLRNKYSNRI